MIFIHPNNRNHDSNNVATNNTNFHNHTQNSNLHTNTSGNKLSTYHQSRHVLTTKNSNSDNKFMDLCTKLLAVLGTICILVGIGLLIYGIVIRNVPIIISGVVLLVVGIASFVTMVILYLKANPSSDTYKGTRTNNLNKVNSSAPQSNYHREQDTNINGNNETVVFALERFDNLQRSTQ